MISVKFCWKCVSIMFLFMPIYTLTGPPILTCFVSCVPYRSRRSNLALNEDDTSIIPFYMALYWQIVFSFLFSLFSSEAVTLFAAYQQVIRSAILLMYILS